MTLLGVKPGLAETPTAPTQANRQRLDLSRMRGDAWLTVLLQVLVHSMWKTRLLSFESRFSETILNDGGLSVFRLSLFNPCKRIIPRPILLSAL